MYKAYPVPGRAETVEQKKEILDRILKAWSDTPDLRLGQFLINAAGILDLFFVEDYSLAEMTEQFANKKEEV